MSPERMAGVGAFVLIVVAAITAALKLPYVVPLALGGLGVALLVGVPILVANKVGKAFDALASANGGLAEPRVEDGKAWFATRGFSDLAGQPLSNFTVREITLASGTVALIRGRIDQQKGLWFRAVVYTANASVPGALCLYEAGASSRQRAKYLGGSVTTGTSIDEKFVAFGRDAVAAREAASKLDADAVNGLFRRARELGARGELAFAVNGQRASLIANEPPTALIESGTAREILETLAVTDGK